MAATAIAAVLSGCAGSGGRVSTPDPVEELITPVVRGAEAGLEARLWVVENRSGALAGALREFGPPPSAGAGEVETWRRNGFRVLEVPLDRLDGVLGALPTIGPRHREWLGMLPEWVEVVKGAQLSGEQLMRMDGGSAVLGAGRLRLVARCWAMPGEQVAGGAAGAVMRLELMPELVTPPRRDDEGLSRLLEGGGVTPRGGVRGMAFERLRLGVVSGGGSAIVIVPEDPDLDWFAEAAGRPESGVDPASSRAMVGPRMLKTPTLGELMLTSLALPESVGDARVVVVLVPRVPERFNLLPR